MAREMARSTFSVTIKTENAAFVDSCGGDAHGEVARILRELAQDIENGCDSLALRDISGNTVGSAGFKRRATTYRVGPFGATIANG